ncbi:MAG: DUF3027 domain-containing protein [Nocardia sp.]|nr:DUF3027 domain-containing protein [Nocardia sp.]
MSAVSVSDTEVRTILAGAVDLARSALVDLEPTGVGVHLGVRAEDECSATHRFEATLPGYHGWQWAVVVAAAPDTDRVTVSESALLPGPDALIAPDFVPWDQRIRPGDLAPGDLLAPAADDSRLAPGYTATGDPEVDEVAGQVGLGRKQVLSREGREDAAERWYAELGPDTEMAKAAPATCESCGFYVPLAGALRACFGVCANAMGADGHVVHMGYGCGAHSDTRLPTGAGSPIYQAYDDAAVELVAVTPPPGSESGRPAGAAAESAAAQTSAELAGSSAVDAGAQVPTDGPAAESAGEQTGETSDATAADPAARIEGRTAGPVAETPGSPQTESAPAEPGGSTATAGLATESAEPVDTGAESAGRLDAPRPDPAPADGEDPAPAPETP